MTISRHTREHKQSAIQLHIKSFQYNKGGKTMKRFTKIMALLMVTALIMGIAAISASAATNYSPLVVSTSTANHTTTLKKYLVVDEDATIPNKTFNFSS
jgi:hypothetical protein